MNQPVNNRWYQQPVVWLFLILLGVTVVACIGLMIIAIKSDDGLVTDDYYKRGNEIGKDIVRDRQAAKLGLSAKLMVSDDGLQARVLLIPMPAQPNPLTITLSHPTQAGQDLTLSLRPTEDGMYKAKLDGVLAPQRWLVQLDDPHGGWRLRGEATIGPGSAVDLKPAGQ
ncbi:FixH family protein [Chitinimonas naiadis]